MGTTYVLLAVVLVASVQAASMQVGCTEKKNSIQLMNIGHEQTYETPMGCPMVDIRLKFVASAGTNNIAMIKRIKVLNNTVPVNTDDDLFTVTLWQTSASTGVLQLIMSCTSMSTSTCMDRASTSKELTIMITANETMNTDYRISFIALQTTQASAKGYTNCHCINTADPMMGTTMDNPIEFNWTAPLSPTPVETRDSPCVGSACYYLFTINQTDAHFAFNYDAADIENIINADDSRINATSTTYMVDMYDNDKVFTKSPVLQLSAAMQSKAYKVYSSMVMIDFVVPYMSSETFKSDGLMNQGPITLNISTFINPTKVFPIQETVFSTDNATSVTLSPMGTQFTSGAAFPTQTVMWKISTSVKDKSNKIYTVGYSQMKCNSAFSASNKIVIRKDSSNGKIVETFESCSSQMQYKDTNAKEIYVYWIRTDAMLAVGDWQLSVKILEKSSASLAVVGPLTLLLAVVSHFFKL